jgi:hypothetical protein
LLEERYNRNEHWSNIAHIPVIEINEQVTLWDMAIEKLREWRIAILFQVRIWFLFYVTGQEDYYYFFDYSVGD